MRRTRRTLLKHTGLAAAAGLKATWRVSATIAGDGDAGAIAEPEHALTRFLMKQEYPRLEVKAKAYRFVWHGRWLGFRLCSARCWLPASGPCSEPALGNASRGCTSRRPRAVTRYRPTLAARSSTSSGSFWTN